MFNEKQEVPLIRWMPVQCGGFSVGFLVPFALLAIYNARFSYNPILLIIGCFLFGGIPGSLVACVVFRLLIFRIASKDLRVLLLKGTIIGILIGLLNYFAYSAVDFCDAGRDTRYIRVTVAIAATGGACGFWGAWQAWKERFGDERWFPALSLAGFMTIFLVCSALLGLFFPNISERTTMQLIFSSER